MQVTITAVDWADRVGARLRRRDREERCLPHDGDADDELPPGHVEVFLIARDRSTGAPVACGALRPADPTMAHRGYLTLVTDAAASAPALISWLFLVPEHRRRGLAQLVLAELELQARHLGWLTLRLEADARRPAALALCATAGYTRLPAAGAGAADGVVVFEKRLDLH